MNWYKGAINIFSQHRWEIPPSEWGISQDQARDMLNRTWGIVRKYYSNRREWERGDPHILGMEVESNYEIYDRFLRDLPEIIDAEDVIIAYREGLLPQVVTKERATPIDISDVPEIAYRGLLGEPKKKELIGSEELKSLWDVANQRLMEKNRQEVTEARCEIFMQANLYSDTADKLGARQADLNRKIYSWSNFPVSARKLYLSVNQQDENVTTEWNGVINSAFLAQSQVAPEDIDGFFKNIDAGEDSEWYTPEGIL